MILTELTCGVAHRFEYGSNRRRLGRNAESGAGLTDSRQPGPDWQLASDEIRAACGAAGLRIVVGKHQALSCNLVQVRGLPTHHASVVCADIEPADIVRHDDDDIRFLLAEGFNTASDC